MAIRNSIINRLKRSVERERHFERSLETFSKLLWPWSESKLVLFISFMATLDYASTYNALKLSVSNNVAEVGPIARWAIKTAGFPYLFLIDMTVIAVLLLLAMGVRSLYIRLGFPGFARTAFVFLLTPYAVIILAIVFNNVLVAFLGHYY